MNATKNSHASRTFRPPAAAIGLMASALLGALPWMARGEEMYHPATNSPGGVLAQSAITSVTTVGTNSTVCWYGMQGWYTVEMSTNAGTSWDPVGRTAASSHENCLTVDNGGNAGAIFRLNQNNAFAGSGACSGCHGDKASVWSGTAHASAYSTIANLPLPAAVKETCYPCHTVGKNQPTGFTSITNTPHLTDVGCENCHGPAAWHKYSDHDLIKPAVSIDPKICGGCHTDAHHPTFDEFELSPHAEVNGDIKYGTATPGVYYPDTITIGGTNLYGYYVTTNADLSLRTNRTTGILHSLNGPQSIPGAGFVYDPGQDRAVGCGICHSAATRLAQLKDYEARLTGSTNALVFPDAHDSAEWTAACATCHDPHSAEHEGQLRNPLWSTNYYTMPTTADKRTIITTNFMGATTTNVVFYSAAFANHYDPNVQICGQCHNSRGSRWDGRSFGYYNATTLQSVTTPGPGIVFGVQTNISYARPPHHSPQYNLLSGIVQPDYLNGTSNVFGAHSLNPRGCAACHMATKTVTAPTEDDPNYTGHEFEPLINGLNGCAAAGCHDGIATTIDPTNGLTSLRLEITNNISTLVGMLNNWAILKGTNLFGAVNANRYKENGWEYTTPGDLKSITNAGPSAADQLKIPAAVRQARFNLYMVAYGNAASLGIHNPTYSRYLLNDASNKVWVASQP